MLRSSSLTTLTVPPQVSPEKPQDAKPRKFEMRDEFASETGSPQIKAIQIHSGVDSLHGSPQGGRLAGAGGPQGPRALRHHRQPDAAERGGSEHEPTTSSGAGAAAAAPRRADVVAAKAGAPKAPSLKPPAGFVPISVEPPADADAVPVETLPSPKARAAAAFGVRLNAAGPPASSPHAWGGAAPPSDASPEHAARSAADYHDAVEEHAQAALARALAAAAAASPGAQRGAARLGPASHRRRGGLRGRPLPRRRGGGGAPPRDWESRGGGGDAKAAAGSQFGAGGGRRAAAVAAAQRAQRAAADRGAPFAAEAEGELSVAQGARLELLVGEEDRAPDGASCATAAARRGSCPSAFSHLTLTRSRRCCCSGTSLRGRRTAAPARRSRRWGRARSSPCTTSHPKRQASCSWRGACRSSCSRALRRRAPAGASSATAAAPAASCR